MHFIRLNVLATLVFCTLCSCNRTKNPDFVDRVLSRRKRFLIFPPGSAVVATMSFTKTLVPRSPSGINMVCECDIFYPLQTKFSDWFPTPKTTKGPDTDEEEYEEEEEEEEEEAMKAKPSKKPDSQKPIIEDGSDNFNAPKHPGEIYVTGPPGRRVGNETPGRLVYKNGVLLEYTKKPTTYWEPRNPVFSRPHSFIRPQAPPANYVYPYPRRPVYSPSHRSDYVNEMDLMRGASRSGNIRPPNSVLFSDMTSRRRNWYEIEEKARSSPREYFIPRGRSLRLVQPESNVTTNSTAPSSIDIDEHKDWHHYRAYKERRDIYDQLQALTSFDGFEIKTCILRMICEANHYLLPPGKSLFQDIFRTLFTLPLKHDLNDEFSEAMRRNATECQTHFGDKCRYSVLGFLLSNQLSAMQ